MCLTPRATVPLSAQQTSEAGAAVVQLGHQWNIDSVEFVQSQQSSEARTAAQEGHQWNIDALEFIPLQQPSGAGAAAAQLGQKWNIDAPEFTPPQQISEARAAVIQLGQGWNVKAPELVPSQQITEAGVVAQPGRRWNIHAPDFMPTSQSAVSQLAQVRLYTTGSACMHCMYSFQDALPMNLFCWSYSGGTRYGLKLDMCMQTCNATPAYDIMLNDSEVVKHLLCRLRVSCCS